jgi:hypothetical protein
MSRIVQRTVPKIDIVPGMSRHAVVIPGRMYGPRMGLMLYVAEAVARRGAEVEVMEWAPPPEQSVERVAEQVEPVVAKQPAPPLLVGKSLGSLAAGVAADRGLPAVWLTPLLHLPECVAALRRATQPFLLVGGTADAAWDGALARELTPHVLEVEGGSHGLMVPGPLRRTTEELGRVTTAVETFLDETVWR